ncbi:hypothetical protein [Streptomyces sp. NPDC060035]|uniref:hypothetical protein n=1 Tax=Streptomyces sp. NPDC060035 TaxID=3347044 RepID=UPI0036C4B555
MGQPPGCPPDGFLRVVPQDFAGAEGGVVGEGRFDRVQLRFRLLLLLRAQTT